MKKLLLAIGLFLSVSLLSSCDVMDVLLDNDTTTENNAQHQDTISSLEDLQHTEHFRSGALAHILEGELNRQGQAVGFHYDGLPSKKGSVIPGTETKPNEYGVYEAKVEVSGTAKTSNQGKSSFFPDEWKAQEVVDAINEAYENRQFINGNTYEGLDDHGVIIRMYLDDQDNIISAFPVY